MLAVIATLNFIINIAWFLVIASAIFSWLYAFNVINVNNNAINMIGRSLYQLTEPLYRPIRRVLPDMGGVALSPDRIPHACRRRTWRPGRPWS